jgi:hypothetical protein
MLRDIIIGFPGFGTWPCDEINYIWRHGNARYPNDEFSVEQASESVKKFIRRAFARVARKQKLRYVVEKTCANSLRVAFVEKVFPDAKFIFIVRDGRDVVASAMKRWAAPLDIPYLLKKARYLPVTDAPYYFVRYLRNRVCRSFSSEDRLSFWGPRFDGMNEMQRSRSLAEVCAMQWVCCVEKSEHDLEQLDAARVLRLRYEDFVTNPSIELQSLAEFLNIDLSEDDVRKLVQGVSPKNVGDWKNCLDQDVLESLKPLIKASMKRYGYF